jgi:hypothetical protein
VQCPHLKEILAGRQLHKVIPRLVTIQHAAVVATTTTTVAGEKTLTATGTAMDMTVGGGTIMMPVATIMHLTDTMADATGHEIGVSRATHPGASERLTCETISTAGDTLDLVASAQSYCLRGSQITSSCRVKSHVTIER